MWERRLQKESRVSCACGTLQSSKTFLRPWKVAGERGVVSRLRVGKTLSPHLTLRRS